MSFEIDTRRPVRAVPEYVETGPFGISLEAWRLGRWITFLVVAVYGGIAAAIFWEPEGGFAFLLHYLAFLSFGVGCVGLVFMWLSQRNWPLCFLGVIPATGLFFFVGRTVETWERQNAIGGGRLEYRDTYRVAGHSHLYRRMRSFDAAGSLQYSFDGPMAGEKSVPHGHWDVVYFRPEFRIDHAWYWYGENVSQGEFELRNK